jgi:HEAT repeat protein
MIGRDTYLDRPPAHWVRLTESKNPLDRRLGVYALGELGSSTTDAADPLAAALADPVSFVRVWAAASLARVAPVRREALDVLVNATEDQASFVRSLAAWHLGRLGSACPGIGAALPMLERLLSDEDPSVRHEAALALERLRPDADVAFAAG